MNKDRLVNILFPHQFTVEVLEDLFQIADLMRGIAKSKRGLDFLNTILSDKRAMLFFAQPSTRTFFSFVNACQIIGMKISEIRDTKTISEVKGESLEDSICTFASYVDLIVIRHINAEFIEQAVSVLRSTSNRLVPIVNAGSGSTHHPTQALVDLYTIYRCFQDKGGYKHKKIAIIGDLKRGRVARSFSLMIALYQDITITFVAPPALQMQDDILAVLDQNNVKYIITEDLNTVLLDHDIFYLTRIQDEYDIHNESQEIDYSKYYFTKQCLSSIKKDAIIMHPLPRRNELSSKIDSDYRAVYWQQVRNGMWIRAALITYIMQREQLLYDFI